jgi:hypothetical protein
MLKNSILALCLVSSYALGASESKGDESELPHSVCIFAHGLSGNAAQKIYYKNYLPDGFELIGQNGPEWDNVRYGSAAGARQSCLAQDDDIQVVFRQIASTVEKNPEANIILVGVSKGAATMINTVGWLAVNHPGLLQNLKAVILDSPFDTINSVAIELVRNLTTNVVGSFLGSIAAWFAGHASIAPSVRQIQTTTFPNYNPDGITPIKAVTEQWLHAPRNLPVIIAHSQADELIPVNSSRRLYCILKEHGFENAYLIEVENGPHANIFWGPDSIQIVDALCSIYRYHNLSLPPAEAVGSYYVPAYYSDEQITQEALARWQPTSAAVLALIEGVSTSSFA